MFGSKVFHYAEVASTNDACFELIGQGLSEGTAVIADSQIGGRGQRGKKWFSPRGCGLYFSLLLVPQFDVKHQPLITLAAALAVAKTIEEQFKLKPLIKWPNDVLVNNKKISGILAEKKGEYVVLGAGININNGPDSFPDDIKGSATSLKIETGKTQDVQKLFESVLHAFERYYSMLQKGQNAVLLNLMSFEDTGALIVNGINGKIIVINAREMKNAG